MNKRIIVLFFALFLIFIIYTVLKKNTNVFLEYDTNMLNEIITSEEDFKKAKRENDFAKEDVNMPKIINIIFVGDVRIALCEDNTVWSWGNDEEGRLGLGDNVTNTVNPQKIKDLENVIKISNNGRCIFALTREGTVYGWGRGVTDLDDGKRQELYNFPVKIEYLNNIADIDAVNDKLFAVDNNGYLYGLGWVSSFAYLGAFENDNSSEAPKDWYKNIKSICCGAGEYNFFIRNDNKIFSIFEQDFLILTSYMCDRYIFPYYGNDFVTNPYEDPSIYLLARSDIGFARYYDLKNIQDVKLMSSDYYTVFFVKNDDTLVYWQSNRIKYHDYAGYLYRPEINNYDYRGSFEEVSKQLFDKVVDMKSGLENTIFLTDNGDLWLSYYRTYDIQDVQYYNIKWGGIDRSEVLSKPVKLKEIAFKKIDFENAVSISTDGKYGFAAVDKNGKYKVWKLGVN